MITVFTPTYNRADKLLRLYQSLKEQDNYEFEWLIVDDGSMDNTEEVVNQFCKEAAFVIRYYWQRNGGKHRAYNKALKLAQGDYFFCVDSDDWLPVSAISSIVNAIQLSKEEQPIIAYKSDETGKQLSNDFPKGLQESRLYELQQIHGCKGEFSLIFPLGLAKSYPFPTFSNEKFMTEAVVYDQIDQKYKMNLLSQVVTICEYQQDGLSNNLNQIMKNNPAGYCLYFMQRIDMQKSLKSKLVIAGKYHAFCMFAGRNKTEYIGSNKLLVIVAIPIGWIFWVYYKVIRKFAFSSKFVNSKNF